MAERDEAAARAEARQRAAERVALAGPSVDDDAYGGPTDRSAYAASIDVGGGGGEEEEEEEEEEGRGGAVARKLASYTAPKALLDEVPRGQAEEPEAVRCSTASAPTLGGCWFGCQRSRLRAHASACVRRRLAPRGASRTERATTASGG